MQVSARFESDFMTQLADAKRKSMEAHAGALTSNYAMVVSEPQNIAFIDAIHFVETLFPNCDRRRRKREYRKALRKALAGTLPGPGLPVTITAESVIDLGNSTDTVAMKGQVTQDLETWAETNLTLSAALDLGYDFMPYQRAVLDASIGGK